MNICCYATVYILESTSLLARLSFTTLLQMILGMCSKITALVLLFAWVSTVVSNTKQ